MKLQRKTFLISAWYESFLKILRVSRELNSWVDVCTLQTRYVGNSWNSTKDKHLVKSQKSPSKNYNSTLEGSLSCEKMEKICLNGSYLSWKPNINGIYMENWKFLQIPSPIGENIIDNVNIYATQQQSSNWMDNFIVIDIVNRESSKIWIFWVTERWYSEFPWTFSSNSFQFSRFSDIIISEIKSWEKKSEKSWNEDLEDEGVF